jgi:hypothetical protein
MTAALPQPSPRALAARLTALEARVADLEGPVLESQYKMRRELIGVRITLNRIAEQAGVAVATDAEIDAALDQAS